MRTTTNFYLANLAAADVVFLSFELIGQSWHYVSFNQIQSVPFYHNFGCGMFIFASHTSSLSSIFLITIIDFDRYFAICHPLKYRNSRMKKIASYIITLFTWIISTMLCFFRALASCKLVYECVLSGCSLAI